jgi:cytochrome P450
MVFGPSLFSTIGMLIFILDARFVKESAIGDAHRKQRKMLNPVFSIAHMRSMTPLFYEVIHRVRIRILILCVVIHHLTCDVQLRTAVERKVENETTEIDLHNWMSRTALELVGQGGLGYSFDPLTDDTRNEYGDAIKRLMCVASLRCYLPLYRLLFLVR